METIKEKRRFTGKLSGFANKTERNFWNKNLWAYLRGHELFRFGISKTTGEPQWYKVSQVFE